MVAMNPRGLITPRRWDIAVKWRFFRHLIHGGDRDSVRVYRWHIENRKSANARIGLGTDSGKTCMDSYIVQAGALASSMSLRGFLPGFAIPVDPNGEILGGAHRLSCALALEIDDICITRSDKLAWAPAWDYSWFVENGMGQDDLERLRDDWEKLATA